MLLSGAVLLGLLEAPPALVLQVTLTMMMQKPGYSVSRIWMDRPFRGHSGSQWSCPRGSNLQLSSLLNRAYLTMSYILTLIGDTP